MLDGECLEDFASLFSALTSRFSGVPYSRGAVLSRCKHERKVFMTAQRSDVFQDSVIRYSRVVVLRNDVVQPDTLIPSRDKVGSGEVEILESKSSDSDRRTRSPARPPASMKSIDSPSLQSRRSERLTCRVLYASSSLAFLCALEIADGKCRSKRSTL